MKTSAQTLKRQRGATLIISMIMLMVITLLVVYSVRSGNTNLRIAGNMQFQAEAFAATEAGIEKIIEQVRVTDLISTITTQTIPVTLNGLTYNVVTAPLGSCMMEVAVLNQDLKPTVPEDVPCFESIDQDRALTSTGKLAQTLSACKNQLWEVSASVTENLSGASMTQVQGLTIRVPATVNCS